MVNMELNVPLLRKAVEWVEEQEQLTEGRVWEQDGWFANYETLESFDNVPWCKTTMCVAGKIATDAGWRQIAPWSSVVVKGDEDSEVADVAAELLGLSYDAARYLFGADLTAADIRRYAELIAGERL